MCWSAVGAHVAAGCVPAPDRDLEQRVRVDDVLAVTPEVEADGDQPVLSAVDALQPTVRWDKGQQCLPWGSAGPRIRSETEWVPVGPLCARVQRQVCQRGDTQRRNPPDGQEPALSGCWRSRCGMR